ncbi:SDR family oxidoreductase [Leptolyngbya sp. FACHB-671]|uniref:SDR family NAD(P)-dependent oxidoreductase n=1 Tax=Leptolyngbya sp. FACHB-671 TaxID=2692812 RepID=UPI001682ADEE|nr:SDR family oxidoreductase [Leptolyngbya sp. FACHB-671]MBD2070476.1 SDR family oxidoreductase [Leptolyngbya sp. FACHB-671]
MAKVALITGGNSGIGKATALLFAQKGYAVAIAARRIDLSEKVQQEIELDGGMAKAIAADVAVSQDVKQMVETVLAEWGQIDVLIHAAGIAPAGTILETDEETWDQVINTNLKGTFLVNRQVLQHMSDRSTGSIVNVASDAGILGCRGLAAYSASKGGVILLTKSTAMDHARQGVRINALCPGPVDTPLTADLPAEEVAHWQQVLPIPRMATALEVAETAYFLAHAEYAMGSCLVLDGGNTAGGAI